MILLYILVGLVALFIFFMLLTLLYSAGCFLYGIIYKAFFEDRRKD